MGKIVTINGKNYTERTIDNIVVDGQKLNGNFIPQLDNKEGEMVNLDINIKSLEEPGTFSISSNSNVEVENKSMGTKSINMHNNEESQVIEKETLMKKIIKSIINFLSKFIS